MNYMVIALPSLNELVNRVNEAIHQGWKPTGGIAITQETNIPGGHMFVQAMVKG